MLCNTSINWANGEGEIAANLGPHLTCRRATNLSNPLHQHVAAPP